MMEKMRKRIEKFRNRILGSLNCIGVDNDNIKQNAAYDVSCKYADIIDKELSIAEYLSLLGMEASVTSLDGLMEVLSHTGKLWDYPMEEKDYCLQENNPVVIVRDSSGARYFEIPENLVERARNSVFRGYEQETTESINRRWIMRNHLSDRIYGEYQAYKASILGLSNVEILDKSYEFDVMTIFYEILIERIEQFPDDIVQKLLEHKNVLMELYERWLKKDDKNYAELEQHVLDEVENIAA